MSPRFRILLTVAASALAFSAGADTLLVVGGCPSQAGTRRQSAGWRRWAMR